MSEYAEYDNPIVFPYVLGSIACTAGVGMAAGITLGYLSLNIMKLKIKLETGTPEEKVASRTLLHLLDDRHLFLSTFVVCNVICSETLPIFLDELIPAWLSIVLSVTAVLFFGEMLPAAIMTGPHQMYLVTVLAGFCRICIIVFYPIAGPLGWMLDSLVGIQEDDLLSRSELTEMVRLTRTIAYRRLEDPAPPSSIKRSDDVLLPQEVNMMKGVLSLAKQTVKELMIPMDRVYMVSSDQVLDEATLSAIDRIGHSRIPVFKNDNKNIITGFLLVKKLITSKEGISLNECGSVRTPLYVESSQSLFEVLDMFQTGKAHIAVVSHDVTKLLNVYYANDRNPSPDCAPVGILTIEDIFKAILQDQIYDEDDRERTTAANPVSNSAMNSILMVLARKKSPVYGVTSKAMSLEDIEMSQSQRNTDNKGVGSSPFFKRTQTTGTRDVLIAEGSQGAVNPLQDNEFRKTGKLSLLKGQSSYSPLGGGGIIKDDDDIEGGNL